VTHEGRCCWKTNERAEKTYGSGKKGKFGKKQDKIRASIRTVVRTPCNGRHAEVGTAGSRETKRQTANRQQDRFGRLADRERTGSKATNNCDKDGIGNRATKIRHSGRATKGGQIARPQIQDRLQGDKDSPRKRATKIGMETKTGKAAGRQRQESPRATKTGEPKGDKDKAGSQATNMGRSLAIKTGQGR
jgi:hypothetical protein